MKASFHLAGLRRRCALRCGHGINLLVGIFGISILVGLGTFAMKGIVGDTEVSYAMADIQTLSTQIIRYRHVTGSIPSQAQGLEALVKQPTGEPTPKAWRQLISPAGLMDPWGESYQYWNPGKHNPNGFDIFSKGPDKTEGTADDVYGDQVRCDNP